VQTFQLGEWRVEPELDRICSGARVVKLEPRVMKVLLHLAAHVGHTASVAEILEDVWPDVIVGPDSVYQAINALRRALGDDPHRPIYIAHLPRKGYRLVAEIGAVPQAAAAAGGAPQVGAPPAAGRPSVRRAALALGVILAALAAVGGYFATHGSRAGGVAAMRSAAPLLPAAATAAALPRSVAVLPFLDMSEKGDLGYFSDGMAEELIEMLSHNAELRVPARTSSFYFKSRAATVADIARELNVSSVLEGSVRRSGSRVRVTVQLIRADNGFHLWSKTYERDLNDVFAVEDDIARAVVQALQVKLLEAAAPGTAAPMSAEDHVLLLQCRFFRNRNTAADADKAVQCFQQLLALDPDDAPVWAGYADALFRQPALHELDLTQQRRGATEALHAAEHALRLDPQLASAHALVAIYHRTVDRDWKAATQELAAALSADPDDPASLLASARLSGELGRFDEMIRLCQRARTLDPLNAQPYARLGTAYLYLGRLPEAEAAVRRRLDLTPEGNGAHTQLGDVLLAGGRAQAALAAVEQEPDQEMRLVGLALAYHALGRHADADAALKSLRGQYERRYPVEIAEVLTFRGETDRAFEALGEAFSVGDPALNELKTDNYFTPLHADARYAALLKRLNLPP